MRMTNCPKCGAYIQGDLDRLYSLPIHLAAARPDAEMELAESLNQDGVCAASKHLVATLPMPHSTESREMFTSAARKAFQQ